MTSKSAQTGEYLIEIDDQGCVNVRRLFINSISKALEIADLINFPIDEKWNTHDLGPKLVNYLTDHKEEADKILQTPNRRKSDLMLEDLRRAFPNELNPDKGVMQNFIYAEEKGMDVNWTGCFKSAISHFDVPG